MSVLDRFARPVPDDARALGERLLANGQVDLHSRSDGSVRASIFDNHQRLETSLHWMPGSPWHSSCSCSAFRSKGICHHVVATALAAHRDGLIPREAFAPRETRPRRGDRAPIFLSSTGQIRRLDEVDEPRPRVHHQPSPPNWKKQIAKLKESAASGQEQHQALAWPSDRQLLYVIDVPASLDARGLVIRLACRDRRSTGEWSRPKTRGISFPDVPDLPDPSDQ